MIADRLANAHRYLALGPRFARAFDYLTRTDLAAAAEGRADIDGASLYAMIQRYTSKLPQDGVWEAHRVYADLQYMVSGEERFGVGAIERFTRGAYDAERDFEALAGDGDFLRIQPGRFLLLWPGEPHMPGMAIGAPAPVQKVVVKIRVD
ncbi:MAG TPA: YhcH/YjgK/YiaL family protein [Vicinamibacterales bacterium]|nr:YhcH/YjgK/YiaL family protein [Vicinamibacterales bacterium]HOG28160.1 YhcH/YjgK/YiaL family protein [Vicinamibacterales bacterium]HOQ60180.1 YhcH/YjgK/YiaL family protein [Vicinamibacterales bacterium]HPK72987.1 YhcH/YjgK/YiaL family protein [Vicinamibacterales bacterium]HPW19871.1 YhcH/YjgK/YiaL family protein [Vicinamibacterales bacterium]